MRLERRMPAAAKTHIQTQSHNFTQDAPGHRRIPFLHLVVERRNVMQFSTDSL